MVLTDKLLSETLDGAQWLPRLSRSSSGHLSQANCWRKGVVVPCRMHMFKVKERKIAV